MLYYYCYYYDFLSVCRVVPFRNKRENLTLPYFHNNNNMTCLWQRESSAQSHMCGHLLSLLLLSLFLSIWLLPFECIYTCMWVLIWDDMADEHHMNVHSSSGAFEHIKKAKSNPASSFNILKADTCGHVHIHRAFSFNFNLFVRHWLAVCCVCLYSYIANAHHTRNQMWDLCICFRVEECCLLWFSFNGLDRFGRHLWHVICAVIRVCHWTL